MNNTTPANAPYYDEIHRYYVRLFKSETEADDLTQEVYFRFYKSGCTYEGERLKKWLFCVARNLANDKFRAKHPELTTPNAEDFSDAKDEKSADPATVVERQDSIQKVMSEAKNFDNRTQEILRLKFVEGLSSSEIGAQLKIHSSTVRKIILGTLQKLREALHKELAVD